MTIILQTERRHWTTRLLYVAMYLVVIAGALTMLYPCLIMISGSVKCRQDFDQFEVIPSFLTDEKLLFRKFEASRYRNPPRFGSTTKLPVDSKALIAFPEPYHEPIGADIAAFIARRDFPVGFLTIGEEFGSGEVLWSLRQWRAFLYDRFEGDLKALNDEMGVGAGRWETGEIPEVPFFQRDSVRGPSAFEALYYDEFRPTVPVRHFHPVHAEGLFFRRIRNEYGRDIRNFNRKYGTTFSDFAQVPLPRTYPAGAAWAPEWEQQVRREIHLIFLRIRPEGTGAYRDFIASRHGSIDACNQAYGTDAASFQEIPVPQKQPGTLPGQQDWRQFIEEGECLEAVEIDSFEFRYRDYLKQKYGALEALNAAHGTAYRSFETVPLNAIHYDAWILRQHRGAIIREFLVRNYLQVINYLVLHGRSFWVTFLYCGLTVLGHLIVNPLAAYALSRYKLRFAHWVLLFCLLTMAFPGEVGMIPRFLLIRELGMLNTIWALVLPGLADGFAIFILKGFFDGLPRDLYEAGLIEGSSERWLFWNVTLSLTKPILAVTAFSAFVSAYGAFLFALIICPDERMWTISVWLYQFQQTASDASGFAGLVLASLPVLLAFILAQRFILRGIVLPVEK